MSFVDWVCDDLSDEFDDLRDVVHAAFVATAHATGWGSHVTHTGLPQDRKTVVSFGLGSRKRQRERAAIAALAISMGELHKLIVEKVITATLPEV